MMDNIKQRIRQIEILALTLFMIILVCFLTYIINESENIFLGLFRIITSPAILVTDFIKVGGIGAAFLNALLILSFNYFLVKLFKIKITGVVIAMFFTVFGFSFYSSCSNKLYSYFTIKKGLLYINFIYNNPLKNLIIMQR